MATFKKQLWVNIAVIVGEFAVASIGLFFLAGGIASLSAAIVSRRTTVLGEANAIETFANLKENGPMAARYQAAMDQLLASQDQLITFPVQVSQLGNTDGVSTDFSFVGDPVPATASAPGNVGFTLDATGPLSNVIAFAKDFEVGSPILLSRLDTFSLTGNGSSYTFSAQGEVYFK
jgi:hypothetical protein